MANRYLRVAERHIRKRIASVSSACRHLPTLHHCPSDPPAILNPASTERESVNSAMPSPRTRHWKGSSEVDELAYGLDVPASPFWRKPNGGYFHFSTSDADSSRWPLASPRNRQCNSRSLHHASGLERSHSSLVDYGQPSHETHPELLSPGEILPGMPPSEFAARRRKVIDRLPRGSILVVAAAPVRFISGIVPMPYRQDSDFLYLTGCMQPGGAAVIWKEEGAAAASPASSATTSSTSRSSSNMSSSSGGSSTSQFQGDGEGDVVMALFLPERGAEEVRWDGRGADPHAALTFFKADQAFPIQHLNKFLETTGKSLLSRSQARSTSSDGAARLFCDARSHDDLISSTLFLKEQAAAGRLVNPRYAINAVRWVKSAAEIALMRKAASITSEAMISTMGYSSSHPHENDIAAHMEYQCIRRGAQRMAYPSVVGAGSSGCTIHYLRNDKQVRPGEALLVDAGCEYFGYAADVTRVWPPYGSFSSQQEDVYEAVHSVMRQCVEQCKPGNTMRDIHHLSVKLLSQAMIDLGIFRQSPTIVAAGAYREFYPTSVGHWLGLDVHDCATVPSSEPLQPGVVLTIEPGLYLPASSRVPERLQGIGIRLEDDILITDTGCEVLTSSIPLSIKEVEASVQKCI